MSRPAFISDKACKSWWTSGKPAQRFRTSPAALAPHKTPTRMTLTSGPAAMLHNSAFGRWGGLTKATPPKGQSMMRSACPPTCLHASACPNSCSSTMTKRATYSRTFHAGDVYALLRLPISTAATINHDQCRNTSIPRIRNSRIELFPNITWPDIISYCYGKHNTMHQAHSPPLEKGMGAQPQPNLLAEFVQAAHVQVFDSTQPQQFLFCSCAY